MDNKFLYNNKSLKERRRELRNHQTLAEKILWEYISKNKIKRLRFLRQYGIGRYVIDFYCPKIRLGIELDGNAHKEEENKLYDRDREKFLGNLDIEIIRFWNDDVLNNSENVLDKLLNKIEQMINR